MAFVYTIIIGILIGNAHSNFFSPNCEYAGFSCLSCYEQKLCVDFFGLIYWSDSYCANGVNGDKTPYCDPTTNKCTSILPEGCDRISFHKCLRDGIFPDENDCSRYYTCTNMTSEDWHCPEYYMYKQEYGKCIFKLSEDACLQLPPCGLEDSIGLYPGDPSLYYTCTASSRNILSCEESEEFNLETKKCVSKCKTVEVLSYSKDCSYYYSCIETETGIVAVKNKCDDGFGFNPNTNTCEIHYQRLCNELVLFEDDFYSVINSIPIVGIFLQPIKLVLNLLNINPVTIMFKFGFNDDILSTGILVMDYVYKEKKLPPTSITIIINAVLEYLPSEIRSIIEMLMQLGIINFRNSVGVNSSILKKDPNFILRNYLENILLNFRFDIVRSIELLERKSSLEITSELINQTLSFFNISESHRTFLLQMLKANMPFVTNFLNKRCGLPLVTVTTDNFIKLNITAIDDGFYYIIGEIAQKIYPDDPFLSGMFQMYVKEQYTLYHEKLTEFCDEFYVF